MKVKKLTLEIIDLVKPFNIKAVEEYSTDDGTRIDVGILNGSKKLLAIEFERTYKWIRHRLIYNGLKAYRAGFENIMFIYPFNKKGILNSWIIKFLEDLGMNIQIKNPDNCLKELNNFLKRTKRL